MSTFIYLLKNPIDNTVFYVGQSINPKKRYYLHLSKAIFSKSNSPKSKFISDLNKNGLRPHLEVVEECDKEQGNYNETKWIRYFKNIGIKLLNSSDGGKNGCKRTIETKNKISKNNARSRNKTVFQFTLEGEFINKFPSAAIASIKTSVPANNIRRCYRGEYSCAGGFHWSLTNTFKKKRRNHNAKYVDKFTKGGEFIQSYNSIKAAQDHTGVNRVNIKLACNGKIKTAGGFIWKFK